MFRIALLSMALSMALSVTLLAGCDDPDERRVTFEVGPDGSYPIPGLNLNNAVEIQTRHVGYEPRVNPQDRADEPSIGDLRVVDDDSTLADDRVMFQGETLRFNYDDTTFELTLDSFYLPTEEAGDPGARATLVVERL